MNDRILANYSQFNHLVLFKKPPFSAGSLLLHIPTSNYKYDVYFHLFDENTVKVSLSRYYSGTYDSEIQDSVVVSIDDYMANMHVVDDALAKNQVNIRTNCAWIEQSDAQAIFRRYKQLAVNEKAQQQIDMFA